MGNAGLGNAWMRATSRAVASACARARNVAPARGRSRADNRGRAAPLMSDAAVDDDAFSRARLLNAPFEAGRVVPVLAGALAGLLAPRVSPEKNDSAFVILLFMACPPTRFDASRIRPPATSSRRHAAIARAGHVCPSGSAPRRKRLDMRVQTAARATRACHGQYRFSSPSPGFASTMPHERQDESIVMATELRSRRKWRISASLDESIGRYDPRAEKRDSPNTSGREETREAGWAGTSESREGPAGRPALNAVD